MNVTVQLKNCTGTNHCRNNTNIIKTDLWEIPCQQHPRQRKAGGHLNYKQWNLHSLFLDWEIFVIFVQFCGPNLLIAKLFKQVFSLKLFLNVEIKDQIQIYCLESSSTYRYMPSDLPTLDNDWRCISFHHLTLPWSISSRCAADAALTSAEFAAAIDLAASKIISSKFRLSSAS